MDEVRLCGPLCNVIIGRGESGRGEVGWAFTVARGEERGQLVDEPTRL